MHMWCSSGRGARAVQFGPVDWWISMVAVSCGEEDVFALTRSVSAIFIPISFIPRFRLNLLSPVSCRMSAKAL